MVYTRLVIHCNSKKIIGQWSFVLDFLVNFLLSNEVGKCI